MLKQKSYILYGVIGTEGGKPKGKTVKQIDNIGVDAAAEMRQSGNLKGKSYKDKKATPVPSVKSSQLDKKKKRCVHGALELRK